jgi:2-oxoisovalerate dehydrogenase E1 component beta subunit
VPEDDFVVPIGKAEVKREGDHISLLCYGMMLHYCLQAAAEIEHDSVSVEVVDLRSLVPLDEETVLQSVRKTG